jgi:hypothetical protein
MERHVRPLSVVCASAEQRPEAPGQPTVPSAQPCCPTNVRSATRKPFSGRDGGTGGTLDAVAGAADELPAAVDTAVELFARAGELDAFDPRPVVLDVQPAIRAAAHSTAASARTGRRNMHPRYCPAPTTTPETLRA